MGSSSGDMNQAAAAPCQLLATKQRTELTSTDGRESRVSACQPELDFLSDLTKQIQEMQLASDSTKVRPQKKGAKGDSARSDSDNTHLASLYCQRAVSVLEYVDYDASRFVSSVYFDKCSSLDAGNDEPEENEGDAHAANDQSGDTVQGTQRALDDALAAISAAPTLASGYFIAAQCWRCVGNDANAMEFALLARQFAPDNADIQQLLKQLSSSPKDTHSGDFSPPLMTSPPLLSVFDTPNQEQQEQQDESEDHGDHEDGDDTETFCHTLPADYQTLRTVFASSWLKKMEQMMHQNVHHQCATQGEVHDLDTSFHSTASLLWKLLGNHFTTTALGLEHNSVHEMLATATAVRPGGGFRLLVESRPLRKWITQTVAPAARRFLEREAGLTLDVGSLAQNDSSRKIVVVMLVRDALLVLTRVLLAIGNWRRCTSMPQALFYAEMCSELARELGGGGGGARSTAATRSRLEMVCTDAYAMGLLELTSEYGEALRLHQESLQAAMTAKDAVYEQRCHHHVGKALMRMQEFDIAKAEFTELLALAQELGDAQMECLTQYELGQYCVQRGNLPQAQSHFKQALTLCNQTANMGNTWRPQSMQHAVAFYAAMKPTRRGAIRIPPPARANLRRESLFCSPPVPQVDVSSSSPSDNGAQTSHAPKLRRPAIWIGPPKLSVAELEHNGKKSLMQALLGEHSEPKNVNRSASSNSDTDATATDGNLDAPITTADTKTTATAKLFPSAPAAPSGAEKAATPPRKQRRAAGWRDSVFTIPVSTSM